MALVLLSQPPTFRLGEKTCKFTLKAVPSDQNPLLNHIIYKVKTNTQTIVDVRPSFGIIALDQEIVFGMKTNEENYQKIKIQVLWIRIQNHQNQKDKKFTHSQFSQLYKKIKADSKEKQQSLILPVKKSSNDQIKNSQVEQKFDDSPIKLNSPRIEIPLVNQDNSKNNFNAFQNASKISTEPSVKKVQKINRQEVQKNNRQEVQKINRQEILLEKEKKNVMEVKEIKVQKQSQQKNPCYSISKTNLIVLLVIFFLLGVLFGIKINQLNQAGQEILESHTVESQNGIVVEEENVKITSEVL